MDYLEKRREENTVRTMEEQSKRFYKEISRVLSEQVKSGKTTLEHNGPEGKEINLSYLHACYKFADKLEERGYEIENKFVDVEFTFIGWDKDRDNRKYEGHNRCNIILEVMDKAK